MNMVAECGNNAVGIISFFDMSMPLMWQSKGFFFLVEYEPHPLPGGRAAGRRFAPPPPPLHGVPSLSVRGEPGLPVSALSGEFVWQAVDGLVVSKDGADMLFKERREP